MNQIQVDQSSHPISVPIYLSSTYKIKDAQHGSDLALGLVEEGNAPDTYRRWGNPTNSYVEQKIAKLDHAAGTILMASGMTAITTVLLSLLQAGDHVVAPSAIYGGTYEFLMDDLTRFGIEVTIINSFDIDVYRGAIKSNTKLIYGETPCNPLLSVLDIQAFAELGKEVGAVTVVDSTFAPPPLQVPIQLGVDICVQSGSKYLSGHSDVLCGVISLAKEEDYLFMRRKCRILGGVLSPFDSFLVDRGLKTLNARNQIHCSNAMRLATFLESHPKIDRVWYPGLESHPQHEIAKKQMISFGGMMSFEVKGGLECAKQLVQNVQVITLAVSLGGTESLIEHPASMTHFSLSKEEREASGISDGLVRFSVGIEDIEELLQDLEHALSFVEEQ
eukprot:TRINITY_DN12943_c0_g1_i1.p1 TRINITY_DN12943_c0_g1~~TRINITY_DN12943_c0_g1_i1.p1  ORF type:complete len:389 (-),score=85.06 TRINITY_DN12943_c0_g1_i1:358-1524(-)